MNTELIKNNYIFIPNLIPLEKAISLGTDFTIYAEDHNIEGDLQAPNSSSMYNWMPALELLCELTRTITEHSGTTVVPTYSYIRVYRTGDDLKKHSDRPSCEISVTVNLGGDCDWPIHIERPDGSVASLTLKPGDAMLYLGCQAQHWRDPIPGSTCVQVFLHYIDSQGPNHQHYFDRLLSQDRSRKMSAEIVKDEISSIDYSQMSRDIRDYIRVIENVVPDQLCDQILREFKDDDTAWQAAKLGNGDIDEKIRNVDIIGIDDLSVMHANISERHQLIIGLNGALFWVMNQYRKIAPGITFDKHSGFQLLRYREGCFYKEHTDSYSIIPRHLSISLHLNDDYEGGEFGFYNQDLKIKAKKGSAVVFPSNFMYPHEIIPVTQGTRYSIITWII